MLEKLLLVMALLGFAHMAFLGLGKSIKLAFVLTDRLVAARRPKTIPTRPCLREISLFKSREEDQWSIYETPTFLRRGLSLPEQLADKIDDRVVSNLFGGHTTGDQITLLLCQTLHGLTKFSHSASVTSRNIQLHLLHFRTLQVVEDRVGCVTTHLRRYILVRHERKLGIDRTLVDVLVDDPGRNQGLLHDHVDELILVVACNI